MSEVLDEYFQDSLKSSVPKLLEDNAEEEDGNEQPDEYDLSIIFDDLNKVIHKIEFNEITEEEEFIECEDNLDSSIINLSKIILYHNPIINPNQFILLIHIICVLNYVQVKESLKCEFINSAEMCIKKQPELIEFLLKSGEVQNYINMFKDIFRGWQVSLLKAILSHSKNSSAVFISNGILRNIFVAMQKSVIIYFNGGFERKDLLVDYWMHVMSALQYFVTYSNDPSSTYQIFKFIEQFLDEKFFSIRIGFVFKILNCLSSCFVIPEIFHQFDFQFYIPFFMSIFKGPDKRGRKVIISFFNTISVPPILYHWDFGLIKEMATDVINWFSGPNSENADNDTEEAILLFFDFVSNILKYQTDMFDMLNEIMFFNMIFSLFESKSHKIKVKIIKVFLSLINPPIWQKSVRFFIDNKIITELFLFIDSETDNEFIINGLLQIFSTSIFILPLDMQKLISEELQNDFIDDTLSRLQVIDNRTDKLLELLKKVRSYLSNE